jgi:hypothetical protein
MVMRRIIAVVALLAALGLCTGCTAPEGGLKSRAADYYNFMVGLAPGKSYSSFLSPAYRKLITKQALKQLNALASAKQEANKRYKPASAKHIAVTIDGRFAYSTIGPELGQSFASVGPVRWVRIGAGWYVYSSSSTEQHAYGSFPNSLSPPTPPAVVGK